MHNIPSRSPALLRLIPALAAVLVPLHLWNRNPGEVDPIAAVLLTGAIAMAAVGLQALLGRLAGTEGRSELCLGVGILLFFNYWDLSVQIRLGPVLDLLIAVQILLIAAWLILFRLSTKTVQGLAKLMAAVLALLCVFQIGGLLRHSITETRRQDLLAARAESARTVAPDLEAPDLYLIIADGFGGEAVLESLFEHPLDSFYGELEKRGFHVVRNSRSNYNRTRFALPSLLNGRLLQPSFQDSDWDAATATARHLTVHSEFFMGAVDSGYAAHFIGSHPWITLRHPAIDVREFTRLPEFALVLWSKTPLRLLPALERDRKFIAGGMAWMPHSIEWTLETFEELAAEPRSRPRAILVHLMSPHMPYYHRPDGTVVDEYQGIDWAAPGYDLERRKAAYIDQVAYLERRLLLTFDRILESHTYGPRPIIVLQGDHGPRFGNRVDTDSAQYHRLQQDDRGPDAELAQFNNLNAVLLPTAAMPTGHPETSVNWVRSALNAAFDLALPPQPDESFFVVERGDRLILDPSSGTPPTP